MKSTNSNSDRENDLNRARYLLRQTELLAKTGSWEYNTKTMDLKWSDGVYELLDCKPQSFKPSVREGLNYIHPDDRDDIFQKIRTITISEKDFTFKTRFRTKKGNQKIIHVSGSVVHGKDHKISKIYGVFQDISLHEKSKTELSETLSSLHERIKELSSLYKISRLSHTSNNPETLLGQAVKLLPSGWQYPEITSGCIIYDDNRFKTKNFKETNWSQSTERETIKGKVFKIIVSYSKKKPDQDEGPFLTEERHLIETIADNLLSNLNQFETEQDHKLLLESTEEGIYGINSDGYCTFINQAAASILGYEKSECIGANMHELIHHTRIDGEPYSEKDCPIYKAKVSKNGCRVEDEVFWRKDGSAFNVRYSSTPITYNDTYRGAVIVFNDLTEQKQIEKKLNESEQLFKSLVQEGSSLTGILDLDGVCKYASPNYESFLGYHPDELIGMNGFNYVHPDDIGFLTEQFSKLKDVNRLTSDPYRFKHKNGQWRWIQSIGTNLIENDIVSGVIINSVDITELIETQKELQISNERYNYLNKATNDAIYEWDIQNDRFEWGDAFQKVFGHNLNNKQFRLSDWISLMHPADAKTNKKSWDKFFKNKNQNKWQKQFRFKHANGAYHYVEETGYMVRNDRGKPIRMIGVLKNITDSKIVELQREIKENLSDIFNKEKGLTDTLDQVLKLLSEFGNYKTGELWLVSNKNKEIYLSNYQIQNQTAEQIYNIEPEGTRFSFGEALPGIVWKNGELTVWDENDSNLAFLKATTTHKIQLKSAIGIPLTHFENIIGVLILFSDDHSGDNWMESKILDSIAPFIGSEIVRKQQEEELQLLFDSSPDILAMAGPNGFFTKVNPAFCHLLGFSEEELTSTPFTDFLHPDDLNQTEKEYSETITGERQSDNFINRYRTKSGNYKWISWASSDVINEDGDVFAFGRDVTEMVELQNLLNNANQLARVGAWELDVINQKTYYSEMTCEILELDKDLEPDFESGINFYREDVRHIIRDSVEQAIADGTPWDLELPLITAKGNERWVRSIGKSEMVDGQCVRVYGSCQDIHERKMIEQDLQSLNEMLQQYARDLEISNTELEQFAYVASHDLQEPLRMITSFMELLKTRYEDQLDEKAHQYIYYATDGAKRMRQVILDLLDFSKVGKNQDPKESVNFNDVIDFVCKMQHKLIRETGAVIEYKDLPVIETYRSPLVQIFQNLISNAIKYSKKDQKPRIEVLSKELNDKWQISVKDNGIGIEESYFEKIFIIFQRLHNKDEYSGTGIGLTIVKKIVENLGGKIWVDSKKGEGSMFHFTIPK